MAEALRTLGVGIEETASSSSAGSADSAGQPGGGEAWRIIPAGLHGPATIDVGNAGTVMRFLPWSPRSPTARSASTATRAPTSVRSAA